LTLPRLSIAFLLAISVLTLSGVRAQNSTRLEVGDPPVISAITVSEPDANGIVTISGVPGAVFPNARLAIRNLYTEQLTYTTAGITGSFNAQIYGPGNTPFWISPVFGTIPAVLQDVPGSLPGGPGAILNGPFPETRQAPAEPIVQIVLDGEVSDWAAYPRARLSLPTRYALRNATTLYFAASDLEAEYAQLTLVMTVDAATYELTIDPLVPQIGALRRTAPDERDLGNIPVAFAVADNVLELRVHVEDIRLDAETVTLNQVRVLGEGGAVLNADTVDATLEPGTEIDGIARPESQLGTGFTRFTLAGAVAAGVSNWEAQGRIDRLDVSDRSEPVIIELDVALDAPDIGENLLDVRMVGEISLQPVVAQTGEQTMIVGSIDTNNGWSNVLTPSGLAIDNLHSEVILGEAAAEAGQILHDGDTLNFGLDFALTISDDVPDGLYVPVFKGYIEEGRDRTAWEANGVLGTGDGISRQPITRLPLVVNVGETGAAHLVWTLFADDPSDGSRGLLSDEDAGQVALSNRVRFNSPTYILQPTNPATGEPVAYPLEPYLLNQMPNDYDSSAAPLIPFQFPSGRLNVLVTRPDGTVDDLGSAPILQNQLSTEAVDERARYGESVPVDIYRLATLNPLFNDYLFDQYGDYTINLSGTLQDVWGNRYEGGGTYRLLVAEQMDLTPGVLPGTPFEVGDALNPVLHIAPGVPADVTITLRVYPLDGGRVRENVLTGQANRYGYFHTVEEVLRLAEAGEYTLDYEARYTDTDGRLWAGSLRSAGVIANPDGALIAHGERGLVEADGDMSPAWFNGRHYATSLGLDEDNPVPNAPYHSGDVAWIADGLDAGIMPIVRVQDTVGEYQAWLINAANAGANIAERAVTDALPVTMLTDSDTTFGAPLMPDRVVNQGYTYFSAVRPGVTARQFVLGADDGGLPLRLDLDDHYNDQIGVGLNGDMPGDYLFLFGGAVLRNEAAGTAETAIYGAVAAVISADDDIGPRVYPPYRGEAGGGDGGALVIVQEDETEMFFQPTAVMPGETLTEGDTLSIAGQVAPTLPSIVSVRITSPTGHLHEFEGTANAIGYFYNPANDFAVDEIGVWTVDVEVRHEGLTSAGPVEPPPPTGGVLGAVDGRFSVYVVAPDAQLLPTERYDYVFPAASPFNFSFPVPEGWTNVQVYHTLTMPGYVIEDGSLPVTGNSFGYQYNPTRIKRSFSNFENEGRVDGPAVSDPLTLVIVATGTDEEGRFQVRSRTYNVLHDRILSLEQ
jgi:hypothetical protein